MNILDKVKIVNGFHNGKEGILTGINNNTASVVFKYEVNDTLYGYVRIETHIGNLEPAGM